ncbi:TonB-dependent receptor [Patescibacteria group bacterium]|nr:TonB-dependent receptor [Patescibacteria group bacterium]
MRRKLIISMLIVEMLILGSLQGTILAEENKDLEKITLEPITITPLRIERRLSEVSSTVSIIKEEEIKETNAKNVPGLLRHLEGVYMYDASGVGTVGRINMRGFWGGMSTHQLILVDGIPQNKGKSKLVDWSLIPLDNIERIEIVRGPASCLYGDNAMSGVINIITKRPSVIPETKISASYGSFDTQNYNLSISGMLERIGSYLGVSRKSTDGFRRHCDYEDIHLNGKLDFLIDQTQDLKLSLDYHQKQRGAYAWALTEAQIEQDRPQARPGSENDKSEVKKTNLGLTYRKDIGKIFKIEETFYYRYEDSESFYTSGSTNSSTQEQLDEEDTYGFLSRLNINPEIFGMEHSFTTGIDLERNNFDYQEYAAPCQIRGAIGSNYKVKRDKIGSYVQDEIKLFAPLKLIAGIRYDLIKFDFTDYEDETNSEDRKMSSTSPKCGIVYTYGKDCNLYANYAQAFRTPTIGQMFTYGSVSNPDLNPEEAENYEAGIRHRFNDYLRANVGLYWMELDNEIWYDYTQRQYKNYGQTSHKGIETSLTLKIIKELTSFVNYSYTRAKNESGSYDGKYLANIPIHKGSLGVKWETDSGWGANLIVTRVGSSYIDSANDDKLPSYTTADLKLSYTHKWWSLFFAIDNLLDERYNSYGFKSGGVKKFSPAPERTFTFGVEAEF